MREFKIGFIIGFVAFFCGVLMAGCCDKPVHADGEIVCTSDGCFVYSSSAVIRLNAQQLSDLEYQSQVQH